MSVYGEGGGVCFRKMAIVPVFIFGILITFLKMSRIRIKLCVGLWVSNIKPQVKTLPSTKPIKNSSLNLMTAKDKGSSGRM